MSRDHWRGSEPQGPEIESVTWVYASGYYDGPTSGMVRLPDGREVWAEMIEECEADEGSCDCGFYRRFQLWALDERTASLQAERHADFVNYVGSHFNYNDKGYRLVGYGMRPQESWHHYEEKWVHHDFDVTEGATPVGWVDR